MKNFEKLMGVSFDRTVYPLDSVMHVNVLFDKKIKNNMILSIFNDKEKLILEKNYLLSKRKPISSSKGFFKYQFDIRMKGSEWKVGKSYVIFASYGKQEVSDSMTIAKRNPVLQTDQSVYLIGSDMLVTVIAPDFDKDNQKAEFVGNVPNGKLTIESKWGKISNYKLRENGDSTGIFQGLVRLIPPYSRVKGRKNRNKAKGNGPLSGKLPVFPGDKINFKFESKSGNAKNVAYASNFGVAIELDKKIYTPTEKISLTIVAPDFNYNSDKIDSIGNTVDNQLTIFTTKGKLKNYKLVETEKNTGIFTGEISLTGSKQMNFVESKKQFGITSGRGPTSGKLSCSKDDILTVLFETNYKTYKAEAQIKWNIAEIFWDKPYYEKKSVGIVRVLDPDMKTVYRKNRKLPIRIYSDSDKTGIEVSLSERIENGGIFERWIVFSDKFSSSERLKVEEGDSIIAEYKEQTLPNPYSYNDELIISASSQIGKPRIQHLSRIKVSDFQILDTNRKKLSKIVKREENIEFNALLVNKQSKSQKFGVILQIKDKFGIVAHIASISGRINSGKSYPIEFRWKPLLSGDFLVSIFVMKSLGNPEMLSPSAELEFKVI